MKYNIVQNVYPELQNLYHWLEVDFNPLKLATRVQSSLEFISKKEELVQYTAAIQDITTMRIVKQVIFYGLIDKRVLSAYPNEIIKAALSVCVVFG